MIAFLAVFDKARGWRVQRADGHDICGAVSEQVAIETAAALTALRAVRP